MLIRFRGKCAEMLGFNKRIYAKMTVLFAGNFTQSFQFSIARYMRLNMWEANLLILNFYFQNTLAAKNLLYSVIVLHCKKTSTVVVINNDANLDLHIGLLNWTFSPTHAYYIYT